MHWQNPLPTSVEARIIKRRQSLRTHWTVRRDNSKAPTRMLGELDNAGFHAYEAMYWAKELAAQNDDPDLKVMFAPVAKELEANTIQFSRNSKPSKTSRSISAGIITPA